MKTSLALGIAAAVALSASAARAQSGIPDNDWRQAGRPYRTQDRLSSPQQFTFELRFGPYYPEIDEEFGGAATPYRDVFDDDPQFYIGVELDWLPLRIPWVGALGPGFGWGYTRTSNNAMEANSCQPGVAKTCVRAQSETALTILPMHVSAVLRFDELMRRTGFPLVPYGKLGLGFATWSASSSQGVSGSRECTASGECKEIRGRAISWGTHMALGGMFLLDWIDHSNAGALDDSTGINHAYVFGEWMNAQLDGIGSTPQLHVGTSTWIVGLALDL